MGSAYRIVMSMRAAADLGEIHDYIAKDSPQNATDVLRRIVHAIDSLKRFPQRYPIYQRRRQPSKAVRRMPETPVLIYYKMDEEAKTVEIITVRHGKRRQPRGFG